MGKVPNRHKRVLLLGSGATTGSGIKLDGKALPTDSGFFSSGLVHRLLPHYPALQLCRTKVLGSRQFEHVLNSLCGTWGQLFILRGFAQRGLVPVGREIERRVRALANHPWKENRKYRQEHYLHQFSNMDSRPVSYYLAELAIWELRVLIKEVYDNEKINPNGNVHKVLWKNLGEPSVVNLNYDTIFDDSFEKPLYYYPGDGTSSDNASLLIIRPHGSLKWTSEGSRSKEEWCDWNDRWENTELKDMGYQRMNDGRSALRLRQPLIVPPLSFKEEVVGNSSMPSLHSPILRQQWQELTSVLAKAEHWIFIGISLASGDDHLMHLLRSTYHDKKWVHWAVYDEDTLPKCIETSKMKICRHLIKNGKTIDTFRSSGGVECPLKG